MKRRHFLAGTGAGAAAALGVSNARGEGDRPAILGGTPVRTEPFPSWPIMDQREEEGMLGVLRSGHWYRGSGTKVNEFEKAYATLTGAKHCVATANGTSALISAIGAAGVEPGDEVIVPPYTFIATVNAVLMHHALPVFVDSDVETFQIDPKKIAGAVTERTTAVIPVHLGGNAADLDAILPLARERGLKVIEDACQAHLAEWRGKSVGTYGDAGCFSFQVSKNLSSGEGGAVLSNDPGLADRIYAFQNNCYARPGSAGVQTKFLGTRGANLRLTEFQGALLLAQMTRLLDQTKTRSENAAYLTSMLSEIDGISPAKQYEGCTRNAYHLYMFRYDPEAFDGLPRARFVKALAAEGIPCSPGYSPLQREPMFLQTLATKGFRRLFPEKVLKEWPERTACPENDRLCAEAVWFTQPMLLGPRGDMDQIAGAVRKLKANAAQLSKG